MSNPSSSDQVEEDTQHPEEGDTGNTPPPPSHPRPSGGSAHPKNGPAAPKRRVQHPPETNTLPSSGTETKGDPSSPRCAISCSTVGMILVLVFGIFLGLWIPRMEAPAPLAALLSVLGHAGAHQSDGHAQERARIMPLVMSMPIASCLTVYKEEIREGVARNRFNLKQLAESLRWHIDRSNSNLRGISVIGLGKPLCMMMIRRESDGAEMLMYNVNITGQSQETASSEERSSFCPTQTSRYVTRHREIFVEFMTETGTKMELVSLARRDAAIVQHLYANEHGHTNCA